MDCHIEVDQRTYKVQLRNGLQQTIYVCFDYCVVNRGRVEFPHLHAPGRPLCAASGEESGQGYA